MEGLLILLGLGIPVGLVVGWVLGIQGWRRAGRLERELHALRQTLAAQGIVVPGAAPFQAPPPVPAAEPAPPPPEPATAEAAALPNPWAVPAAAAAAPPPAPAGPGLEALLTLRWGTWLGAGALLLAGVFLVRFAIEEGWLGPAMRCFLAALLGLALVGAAEWLRRRPLPDRPNIPWPDQVPAALAAGGVATLFGAAYAATELYALLPPLVGFVLLAVVALAGIALALLHGPLVAAVGILGAYATPILVATGDPSLPGLFAYLLVVTAAALAVLRQVAAVWLGWAATIAAALWVIVGGMMAPSAGDLWAPALFVPAAAALHLFLLPGTALESEAGRRLAWVPFAVLAGAGLMLVTGGTTSLGPATGLLLLTPVAVLAGAREARLDRMPWLAALAGLLLLLAWPIAAWVAPGERVTVEGMVQAILPGDPWPPAALMPFLAGAVVLAAMHAAAGLWFERRAPHALRWAGLVAAVPVLVLLAAYARARGFALDLGWGFAALALAGALVGTAALAMREGDPRRAGAHAAGATAALALAAAMVLSEQWLTLAVALFLPPLAWIEGRADLPALRKVALVVAGVVLARLLLNPWVAEYEFGDAPVLNGLLLGYGVPAASFALASVMFRRRGDDVTVAVLEAGAIAFAAVLTMLEIRHAMGGGAVNGIMTFREAAFQVTGLAVLATLLRGLDARLGGRPVVATGWQLLQGLAVVFGIMLLMRNPMIERQKPLLPWPVFNELLFAYLLPALLAALAARATQVERWIRNALGAYAVVGVFAWTTLEVRHAFNPDDMVLNPFWRRGPGEAELYAYSGAWLLLAGVLLALGIRGKVPALRLSGLGVMAVAIAKAFLVDMSGLEGLWRVLSFLGLGLALIALGWVYRRFVVLVPAR
ncbi:DUF2339 domain-containing protein [Falsiroseomonas sp. HW251]|uniref:DUF2339 domain-containing protein n=1 Tax=Falsiroseomonas sp. HW251 TaxID=3390998 RepID=UPI003D31940A